MNCFDVLYIHPTKKISNTQYCVMPVGIFALLNLLANEGYDIYGINYGTEKSLDPEYSIIYELKGIKYKVLLIDLHWYEHSYGAMQIAELSKTIYPDVPIVIGGYTSTIFASDIILDFKCIDYIVKGDSEQPIKQLVKYLINKEGELADIPNICYRADIGIVNRPLTYICKSIDSLDYISCDFFKNKDYIYLTSPIGVIHNAAKTFWISIARGCNYNCTYCCGSNQNLLTLFGREHMICRSPEAVANDIKRISTEGVKIVCPTQDFDMLGEKYYKKLFSILRDNNVAIGIYLECFQLPSNELLLDIKNTFDPKFTRIEISPLTGDESVRANNGKCFTNSEFFKTLHFMAVNNINIEIYYSLNLAFETGDTFADTMDQMKDIIMQFGQTPIRLICKRVVLDPLAPMRENGYGEKSHLNTFIDYYNYCKNEGEEFIGYNDSTSLDISKKILLYNNFREEMLKYKKQNNMKFSIC